MRCTECGKENSDSAKICTSCGTKLVSANKVPPYQEKPRHSAGGGKMTVIGKAADRPSWDGTDPESHTARPSGSSSPEPITSLEKCQKCSHYPLVNIKGVLTCPNCGFSAKSSTPTEAIAQPQSFQDNPPSPGFSPPKSPKQATQMLSDIQLPGDNSFKLVDVKSGQAFNFEGDEVNLTRDKLGTDSAHISRENHASIVFENDEWKIMDKSSNKATYIQVVGAQPIQHGTTIILGNKFYRFETD